MAALSLMAACSGNGGAAVPSVPAVACVPPPELAGVTLPDRLPAGLPLPPTYQVVRVQEEPRLVRVVMLTGQEFGQLFDFYKRALPEAGFRIALEEREAFDAEIIFDRDGERGDLALKATCGPGRSALAITWLPAAH